MGHNELLLRAALRGRARERVVISVKFGAMRDPAGAWLGVDARPAAVRNFIAYTLRRLGTDYIDIYRPGRLDPAVPIEDTIGAIADLVKQGYVRHIGLSEVGAETLRRAHAVHPICDVQIEYSLVSRGIEAVILPTARALGVGITAYGVLSRGLLSGSWSRERALATNDSQTLLPRFSSENLAQNLAAVERLRGRSPSRRLQLRKSPSPGFSLEAGTSCRSSERAGATAWLKPSARSISHSLRRTSLRSRPPCPPRR